MAGLVAALINVEVARDGHWSKLAVATSVIMGACVLVLATLYVAYRFIVVPRHVEATDGSDKEDVLADNTV